MRSDADIETAMRTHGDAVWRVCLLRMGSRADAQDMLQETFLAYATHDDVAFSTEEHRKAWLIKVATNRCIDALRSQKPLVNDADAAFGAMESVELSEQPEAALWEVSEALDALPGEQREALYLTACEGYSAVEVSRMMQAPVNTVYSWVARAKTRLKEALS